MFSKIIFSLLLVGMQPNNNATFSPEIKSENRIDTRSKGTWCFITGTGVRMRETPSLQGRIISSFGYYEYVELIRWSNDGNWCRVRKQNGLTGWVYADYVGDCSGDK